MPVIQFILFFLLLGAMAYGFYVLLGRQNDLLQQLGNRLTDAPAAGAENVADKHGLRLQACERFTLMLERISVPNLLLRVGPGPGETAQSYTARLLLTIREEVEYNVTQQIYVSDSLWRIITQARDNVSQLIVRAAEGADDAGQVANRLRIMSSNQPDDAVGVAQAAIRREASSVLAD